MYSKFIAKDSWFIFQNVCNIMDFPKVISIQISKYSMKKVKNLQRIPLD